VDLFIFLAFSEEMEEKVGIVGAS